jgi:hypothetical protein
MMSRLLAAFGVVLGVVGLIGVLAPGVVSGLPGGRGALVLVGAAILLQGVRVVNNRRRDRPEELETPDAEVTLELPTPGDDADADLRFLAEERRFDRERRRRIRDRMYAAAVEAVARRRGCSEEAARTVVEDGTWTDDPHAAAFFTNIQENGTLTDEIRYVIRNESVFARRARHAADAVHRLAVEGERT